MNQGYTSAATSINRDRLPAVYSKAVFTAGVVLDYGCGKYTDHIREYLRTEHGSVLLPYDPYNQPDDVNQNTMKYIRRAISERVPVDIVCSNVLNVIDDDGTVLFIADQIEELVHRTGGTAYITVYEGDKTGNGRQTGPDQYQRNQPLREYLKYFRRGTVRKGMIVIG